MSRPGSATRTARGHAAETLAAAHLEAQGYRVVARNHRCAAGEIDLIAWEGDILCFVEVRSRRDESFGDPLETIGAAKQRRLVRAAADYLSGLRGRTPETRFDAVGIVLTEPPQIRLVRQAFEVA